MKRSSARAAAAARAVAAAAVFFVASSASAVVTKIHLTTPAGPALGNATIQIVDPSGKVVAEDESDDRGAVLFDLPSGDYSARTVDGRFSTAVKAGDETSLEIPLVYGILRDASALTNYFHDFDGELEEYGQEWNLLDAETASRVETQLGARLADDWQSLQRKMSESRSADQATGDRGTGAMLGTADQAELAAFISKVFEVDDGTTLAQKTAEFTAKIAEDPAAVAARQALEDQNVHALGIEAARLDRLAVLDASSELVQRRMAIDRELRRFSIDAKADGIWTPAEKARYDELSDRWAEAWELTPEEQAAQASSQTVRDQVLAELYRTADNLDSGTARTVREAEAAIGQKIIDWQKIGKIVPWLARDENGDWKLTEKDLRLDLTITGKEADEMIGKIVAWREALVRAENLRIAAQRYLQRTDLTPDQRHVAEQVVTSAGLAQFASEDAIAMQVAVLLGAVAVDGALILAGGPAGKAGAWVSSKASPVLAAVWTRVLGVGARIFGREVGEAAGSKMGGAAADALGGRAAPRTSPSAAGEAATRIEPPAAAGRGPSSASAEATTRIEPPPTEALPGGSSFRSAVTELESEAATGTTRIEPHARPAPPESALEATAVEGSGGEVAAELERSGQSRVREIGDRLRKLGLTDENAEINAEILEKQLFRTEDAVIVGAWQKGVPVDRLLAEGFTEGEIRQGLDAYFAFREVTPARSKVLIDSFLGGETSATTAQRLGSEAAATRIEPPPAAASSGAPSFRSAATELETGAGSRVSESSTAIAEDEIATARLARPEGAAPAVDPNATLAPPESAAPAVDAGATLPPPEAGLEGTTVAGPPPAPRSVRPAAGADAAARRQYVVERLQEVGAPYRHVAELEVPADGIGGMLADVDDVVIAAAVQKGVPVNRLVAAGYSREQIARAIDEYLVKIAGEAMPPETRRAVIGKLVGKDVAARMEGDAAARAADEVATVRTGSPPINPETTTVVKAPPGVEAERAVLNGGGGSASSRLSPPGGIGIATARGRDSSRGANRQEASAGSAATVAPAHGYWVERDGEWELTDSVTPACDCPVEPAIAWMQLPSDGELHLESTPVAEGESAYTGGLVLGDELMLFGYVPSGVLDKQAAAGDAWLEGNLGQTGSLTIERDAARVKEVRDHYYRSKGSWEQSYDDQWALKHIGFTWDADSPWRTPGVADHEVVVAMIDSGLNWHHPDLDQRQLWRNPGEIPGNRVDDDGNGYVDDIIGWNFVSDTNIPWDRDGHGTFVTGVLAARTNNERGIAGMNPKARIMVLKAIDDQGNTRASFLARAIVYAADNGARLINLSVGGRERTRAEQMAIRYAVGKGCLVVAAAGNDGEDVATYSPAGLAHVLTVASTGLDDQRAPFSNWGGRVDLSAPGVDVLSLRAENTNLAASLGDTDYDPESMIVGPDRAYIRASGTSFSVPLVVGAASLLLSRDPTLTNVELERILEQSARDLEVPGRDRYTGYGLVDVKAALKADRNFFLEAEISGVAMAKAGKKQVVRVTGTASADQFRRAWIEVGRGDDPAEWIVASEVITSAVVDGVVGDLPVEILRGAKRFTLRLVTQHTNGQRREARFTLDTG